MENIEHKALNLQVLQEQKEYEVEDKHSKLIHKLVNKVRNSDDDKMLTDSVESNMKIINGSENSYTSLVFHFEIFVIMIWGPKQTDTDTLTKKHIRKVYEESYGITTDSKSIFRIKKIRSKSDYIQNFIWSRHMLSSFGDELNIATNISVHYCKRNLVDSNYQFLMRKRQKPYLSIYKGAALNYLRLMLTSDDDPSVFFSENYPLLQILCFFQTLFFPKHFMYKLFAETGRLKLIFEHLLSVPIEDHNIYKLMVASRLLNVIIVRFPIIGKHIFVEGTKLYQDFFEFWRRYMKFYWKQKSEIKKSTDSITALFDELPLHPMVIVSIKPNQVFPFRAQKVLYTMDNKVLIYEFLLDSVANILTSTVADSKHYWYAANNRKNIMHYLLSKENCNFLFNWFIEQYKMNLDFYKQSKAKQWIDMYQEYFWTFPKLNGIFYTDEFEEDPDDAYDFEQNFHKFSSLEYNIANIIEIRSTIAMYYHKRKKRFKMMNKDENLCENVRELFTRCRLKQTLLSNAIIDIERSKEIYWKLLEERMSHFMEINACLFANKKRSKQRLLENICCSAEFCLKNKRENKMYVCKGCRFMKYCSKKCQKKDWNKYHRNMCKQFASMIE